MVSNATSRGRGDDHYIVIVASRGKRSMLNRGILLKRLIFAFKFAQIVQ